jgi:hypothetical protein
MLNISSHMKNFIKKIKNKFFYLLNPLYPKIVRVVAYSIYRKLIIHAAKAENLQIPLPQLGGNFYNENTSGKGKTTIQKWELISPLIGDDCKTAADIGCFHGYFSLQLAAKNIFTIGYEPLEDLVRMANEASFVSKTRNVSFTTQAISPENIDSLFSVDVIILMSVMQRWNELYGRDVAENMLKKIWAKTKKILIFEYPNPVSSSKMSNTLKFLGSTENECEKNISLMLSQLPESQVQLLGYLPTDFRPDEKRHLFAIKKL